MNFNINNLILVLSLILGTQVVALFVQYKVNRTYKGIGYWLIGSTLMALGFILMPLVVVKTFDIIARIANPTLILGHIFLYIGIKQFLNRKLNKWVPITIFAFFNLAYYYFMFIDNNVITRTCIISTTIASISFLIAYELLFNKDKLLLGSTNFTAVIFFLNGFFYLIRFFLTMILPTPQSYIDKGSTLIPTIIFSIIISNLWTLGLILMVNHRLNIDIQLEKENLQLIFNTNIDAQLITRLDDGLIVDVNDEFSILSGYSKAEIIEKSINANMFWYNLSDRKVFTKELSDNGICQNMEFVFQRRDKTQFAGTISAKIINLQSVTHIISVVRDITKRKLIESEMQELIQQLEIERNTAQLNSITDSLTGLFNRGYIDKTLRIEFARLSRSGSMLSLIMLDIDHFKKFNDNYGHLAGDKCLQMIATLLKNTVVRASDVVARYGGEEFIVILPETDENGAKILGEKFRKGTEDLAIPHMASETSEVVTVSVGVLTVYPTELISPDQALNLVDKALYLAKENSRNCCVIAPNVH